jgi:hypothetical protein
MKRRRPAPRPLARGLRFAAAFALAAATTSCGSGKPPETKATFDTTKPHWQDVFDRVPDIVVLAHPGAMARDPIYGPLLKSLSRMMAARAPQTAGTRAAEVLESCDEVIFALRERGSSDATVVLRGVRADIDARKLTDQNGRAMWAEGPRGTVTELTRAGAADGSLFVLSDRTWVFAMGDARARAREAFAHPFDRPPPLRDDASLFVIRLDGPSLVQGVPRLRAHGAPLEPLGRRLQSLSVALRPGKEGLVATLTYSEEDAAAFAETLLKQVTEALDREGSEKTKWLGQAKVDRPGNYAVVARVSLPPKLLEELPNVSAAELGF